MGASFSIKVKSANGFTTARTFKTLENGAKKEISTLVTDSIKQDVVGIVANAVEESVARHNERVLLQTAMFFQRAVTRTPKDETYEGHRPDDDYVWKHWKVLYYRRAVTAEEMGEKLFENEQDFNSAQKIRAIADILKERLFSGYKVSFEDRPKKIKSIRIENTHPRFAMLEYGGYKTNEPPPREGKKHWHGLQNGYSVQAPYGMYRITQAEMSSMTVGDFDKWLTAKRHRRINRVPTQAQMKELVKIIGDKTHLSDSDIEKITEVYGK